MEDFMLRLIGSGGSIDGIVVFSFIAFALVYFLAPVLGYPSDRRGLLLIALYLLLGYCALTLLQLIIQYIIYLGSKNNRSTDTGMINLGYIFGILKLGLFLAAQAAFVFGLQGLRRDSAKV